MSEDEDICGESFDHDFPEPEYIDGLAVLICRRCDLMVAHPPCTYLTNSGVRWLHSDHERWQHLIAGAVFFRDLLSAPIPRIAVENPLMHHYAADIVGRRQTQTIHPWQFGHPEQKATGLWLKNLPPLITTEDVKGAMLRLPKAERSRIHHMPATKNRWKLRSVTYRGIAEAMATQWGALEAVAA